MLKAPSPFYSQRQTELRSYYRSVFHHAPFSAVYLSRAAPDALLQNKSCFAFRLRGGNGIAMPAQLILQPLSHKVFPGVKVCSCL